MKRLLSAFLLVLLSTSIIACDTEKTATSLEDSDIEQETQPITELPASIDLRNYNGKNYVTPAKRQLFNDCWSFGTSAAAEISYLYANNLGVPAGEVNDKVDFSEKYNVWYVFHSITEEDVKIGKIRKSQVGEGYDASVAESRDADTVYYLGGPIYSGPNLFASGFTPVDESVSVNGERPYFYSGKYSEIYEGEVQYSPDDDWSLPLNSQYRNPSSNVFFRDSFILPTPASIDENGEYKFDETAITAIKSEIAKGHGVAFAALVYGSMNYENWATYNLSNKANHIVTIVGYDDNYAKENFALTTENGEIDKDSIPPADGAFIIKNSEGETGIDGSGYFYLSYYDHSIAYPISFEFESSDSVKYQNPNYDQYDLLFIGWCGYSDYDCETKIANVFDAEEDEYIYQIAYKTIQPNTSVHYEIYKNMKDGNPDSGTLLEKGDTNHKWGGYHKLDLRDEYELKKGEKYSVVLTMTYTDYSGTSRYTDVIPYATSLDHGVTANGVINKGESYLFTDGKWNDISNLKDVLATKAYEQNIEENMPEMFKSHSVDDIAVDNYPIKAILIPKSEHK